jgi:predicted membrane protein
MYNKLLYGAILIFIGVSIFLSLVFNISIGQFWPLFIIIPGIFSLFQRGNQPIGSIIIITVGSLFLLGSLDILNRDSFKYIIPAIFVGLGLYVIFWKSKPAPSSDQNQISYLAVMGGAKDAVKSKDFQGGSIMAIMGGAEIDLVGANISGKEASLEIISVMGGVDLKLPLDWEVKITGVPILGGWDNATTNQVSVPKTKILNIAITSIMGGVSIRN